MTALRLLLILSGLAAALTACAPLQHTNLDTIIQNALESQPLKDLASDTSVLAELGFTAQVGAFFRQDNAVRLEERLRARGIEAYSFLDPTGLYKVRFGDHSTYDEARRQALRLQQEGIIDEFFIVLPEEHASVRIAKAGKGNLREELVTTARRFIGVPYRWGGESARQGFDCSGLTMVVYRLNGLNLPRNSAMQYGTGRPVGFQRLQSGDLVFFATNGDRRVSHVGLYIGDDLFIHAPRKGKTVRIERLSNSYFKKRFVGARTYL